MGLLYLYFYKVYCNVLGIRDLQFFDAVQWCSLTLKQYCVGNEVTSVYLILIFNPLKLEFEFNKKM